MKRKHWTIIVPAAVLLSGSPAWGIELREAVQAALSNNPEIRQAVSNKVATQEELNQARGLYYPRISVEGRAGVRELRNPTRRSLGIADETLWPIEGALIGDQLIYDSGRREAQIRRDASRTDAAAARVEERSEFIALNVSRSYIDYVLQQRLVAIAQDNATFHERLAANLREGVSKGSISIADQQQAEERLQAARARVTLAQEDLEAAGITFQSLTGLPIDSVSMPPDLSRCMPTSLAEAEALARQNNPRIQEAMADLASSRETVRMAQAEIGPRLNLEGRARAGRDIDGFSGRTTDLLGNFVLRWDLYNGGIKEANAREQQGRAAEAHGLLFQRTREAEEASRTSWSRLQNQSRLVGELEQQGRIADDLLLSYQEQFNIGRRSLLDVLDAQNTRYNVQQQTETARLSQLYAQYRVLASVNRLTDCLGVAIPTAAYSNMRERYGVNPIPPAELQENSVPAPAMGPPAGMTTTSVDPAAAGMAPADQPVTDQPPTGGR